MFFRQLFDPDSSTYTYLVADDATHEAVIIDPVLPLERQVRIAAGALVVAGVVCGAILHPGWYAVAGLVGAGLVYAGITGQCGMTFLFSKLPWNQSNAQTGERLATR